MLYCVLVLNILKIKYLSDSKRQQTIAVDYKRLINGLVLSDGFSLLHNREYGSYDEKKAF